jgi:hypothetical protein
LIPFLFNNVVVTPALAINFWENVPSYICPLHCGALEEPAFKKLSSSKPRELGDAGRDNQRGIVAHRSIEKGGFNISPYWEGPLFVTCYRAETQAPVAGVGMSNWRHIFLARRPFYLSMTGNSSSVPIFWIQEN